jgi:hypothetical protein
MSAGHLFWNNHLYAQLCSLGRKALAYLVYKDLACNNFAFCLVCLRFIKLGYLRPQNLAVSGSHELSMQISTTILDVSTMVLYHF